MGVTHKPVTAEELLETLNDGLRRDLRRGEVHAMAPAGYEHGGIAQNIAASLDRLVRDEGADVVLAAETEFVLSANPDPVRASDVAFVTLDRAEAAGEVAGYWPGASDLAVEKVPDRPAAGTRMALIAANPRGRTVTVRRSEREALILSEVETIEGGEVVPVWTLTVADVLR